jgi:crotonobetainyl-CoA:carnitine CoA-transferase CaiB-like acyl-CoA transferase
MLNLMEAIVPEYDRKGKVNSSLVYLLEASLTSPCSQVREPSGSSVTGVVPTNAYPCLPLPSTPASPTYIIIGANGDTIYTRLMRAIGREDLIGPAFAHNHHRVARQADIEEAISSWTAQRHVEEVVTVLEGAGVPVGRVVGVKEIMENEQVKARGAVEDVWVGGEGAGWNVKMQRVFPLLDGCDAKTRWAGPDLGAHTEEVLGDLGLSVEQIIRLRGEGIIG